MSTSWVVNASPLILLAKVHRLGLLRELAERLGVPATVVAEIEVEPESDPARAWLKGDRLGFIQSDLAPAPAIAAWDLGGGELAVLNWAFHHRD